MICISIRCANSRQEEALKRETRCLRSAQLISIKGLSVAESLAQADVERQAQEMIEQAKIKEEQSNIAVQRVLISWPEFAEADVRAALCRCCDDEDAAIDLLLDGFRAQPELCSCQVSIAPTSHLHDKLEVEREEYPRLSATSVPNMDIKPKSFTLGRTSRNAWVRKPKAEPTCEDFPSLTALKPQVPVNVASGKSAGPARLNRFTCHSRRAN